MALRVQASEALSPLGFSLAQFSVLMSLKRRPDQSNADLARMAFVTPQAMGELLKSLENANLVRRKPHKQNARTLLARLTPAGETVLGDCKKVLDKLNERMFSRMSAENRKQFGALLELSLVGLQVNSSPYSGTS
jgi:DNA-binding MarR family transcriptional regulator